MPKPTKLDRARANLRARAVAADDRNQFLAMVRGAGRDNEIVARDTLTPAEYRKLLAAKRIVGAALATVLHRHPNPGAAWDAWSRVSLWLEDVT